MKALRPFLPPVGVAAPVKALVGVLDIAGQD